jgi:hypothetical protein
VSALRRDHADHIVYHRSDGYRLMNPIYSKETRTRQYGSGWTPHLTWLSVGL